MPSSSPNVDISEEQLVISTENFLKFLVYQTKDTSTGSLTDQDLMLLFVPTSRYELEAVNSLRAPRPTDLS